MSTQNFKRNNHGALHEVTVHHGMKDVDSPIITGARHERETRVKANTTHSFGVVSTIQGEKVVSIRGTLQQQHQHTQDIHPQY